MALEHAILTSLSEKSGSGYELTRRFDKSIGFFWHASHQQIYRTLARMHERGWIDRESVAQSGKPDKNTYRVNAAGRGELQRWIAEPSETLKFRSELGVKLRATTDADVPALIAEIERERKLHFQQLSLYRQICAHDFPNPDELDGTDLRQYLILLGGIRAEEGFHTWCEEILARLSPDGVSPDGVSPKAASPTVSAE